MTDAQTPLPQLAADPPGPLTPGRFLWRAIGHHRALTTQSALMVLLMAVVNLPLPLLNKIAIDHLLPTGRGWELIALGAFAFVVRGGASGFQVFQNYVVRRIAGNIGHDLRDRMGTAMLNAPFQRFADGEMSGLVGRIGSDVRSVENIVIAAQQFLVRPLGMIAVMATVMWLINPIATLLLLGIAPIAFLSTRRFEARLKALEETMLARRQELQHDVAESLDNLRVVRGFGQERAMHDRARRGVEAYTDAAIDHAVRAKAAQVVIDSVLFLPFLTVVLAGTWMTVQGSMSTGDFMAFIAFESLLRSPLGQMSYYIMNMRADLVAVERVQEVAELPPERRDGSDLPWRESSLTCDQVDFSYPDRSQVLQAFDLAVRPGERIAVVGPSGAGKSTLINLLLGFYDHQGGTVAIGGHDQHHWHLPALRRHVGVVFQDTPLFDGTVRYNLLLDQQRSEAAIWEALEQAQAADFVRSMPEGLETEVGTKGLKLSGGQRQRLAIARVMLRDPQVVILDEATSSLDSVTEQRIQNALERLLHGRTAITIAHRLSTIVGSDRICYLADGRIVESGTHEQLLQDDGPYAALYRSQFL